MEAQRKAVASFAEAEGFTIIAEGLEAWRWPAASAMRP